MKLTTSHLIFTFTYNLFTNFHSYLVSKNIDAFRYVFVPHTVFSVSTIKFTSFSRAIGCLYATLSVDRYAQGLESVGDTCQLFQWWIMEIFPPKKFKIYSKKFQSTPSIFILWHFLIGYRLLYFVLKVNKIFIKLKCSGCKAPLALLAISADFRHPPPKPRCACIRDKSNWYLFRILSRHT